MADTIRARPGLVVDGPTAIEVGGVPGVHLVVGAADPDIEAQRFMPVFEITLGAISITSGRRLELRLVDTALELLAVLLGGSVRGWEFGLVCSGSDSGLDPLRMSALVHDSQYSVSNEVRPERAWRGGESVEVGAPRRTLSPFAIPCGIQTSSRGRLRGLDSDRQPRRIFGRIGVSSTPPRARSTRNARVSGSTATTSASSRPAKSSPTLSSAA